MLSYPRIHANSAVDAYNRILSMCVATGLQLSENKILEFILEAIPIVLFKRQLPDGRRVYDEIFEGTGIKGGKVIGNTLYKYEIEKNIYGTDGQIEKVIGHHKKVSKMSDELFAPLTLWRRKRGRYKTIYVMGGF